MAPTDAGSGTAVLAPDAGQGAPTQLAHVQLQKRGCAPLDEIRLPGAVHQVLLPLQDSRLSALVLRPDRKTLEWWSGPFGTTAQRVAVYNLNQGAARLSLVRKAADLYVLAWIDDQGGVWSLRYAARNFGQPKQLGTGADRRFAPALYEEGGVSLLAYVASVNDTMHTFVVRSHDATGVDITPPGHGAAAPSFVLGAEQPVLVVVDARAGVSPLLELSFDAQGTPRPALVRTPISQPYSPPLLRAVAVPEGEIEVAFSAIGKLAATAIGRVPLRRALAPVALLPSRGYGELSFDVTRVGRAVVYALESPLSEEPHAPRGLELKWLDRAGEGQTLKLDGTSPALWPSIAATALMGEVVVGYVVGTEARVVRLRCDA